MVSYKRGTPVEGGVSTLRYSRPYLPNTVELIPTLGALSPRDGPVQDPVLTVPLVAPPSTH